MSVQEIFEAFSNAFPQSVWSKEDVLIWTDGSEILCKTEWLADTLADVIDHLAGETVTHTGYYDPEEDAKEQNGPFRTTGWYYIDFD